MLHSKSSSQPEQATQPRNTLITGRGTSTSQACTCFSFTANAPRSSVALWLDGPRPLCGAMRSFFSTCNSNATASPSPSLVFYSCFTVQCHIVQTALMSHHSRPHPRATVLRCCCVVIVIFHVASFNGKLVLQTQKPQLSCESSCSELTKLPSVMAPLGTA